MVARPTILLILALCAPAALAADPFKPSQRQQLDLGARAAADIRKHEKMLPDTDPRSQLVKRVGNRIVDTFKEAEKGAPWKFSFEVIDSKEVNAFALPGGPTFVFTGLLSKLKTEDELAGVLGHELTHVRHEHWAKMYSSSMSRSLGLNLLLIVAHANSALSNLANITNEQVVDTQYSRKYEAEADRVGMDTMVTAGYNPEGMADTFRLLEKESKGGKMPEFLSDHPSDNHRIQTIEDRIKGLNQTFPAQVALDPAMVNPKPAKDEKAKDGKEAKPDNPKPADQTPAKDPASQPGRR